MFGKQQSKHPGCLSRIPAPDFYPSRIPDLGSKHSNQRDEKKICCFTFFCSHKFHKIENYFIFEIVKKKFLGQFLKFFRTFYPKICHKALKNMGLVVSGNREKPIPDPGTGSRVKKAPDFGSGSAILLISNI
jgi:hypothetical protein